MNRKYILWISLLIGLSQYNAFGQSNLLSNGGFEGHIPSGDYPHYLESFDDRNAPSWFQYNNDEWVRWYIDSVWIPANQNQIDPNFQNGHFKSGLFNAVYPWDAGGSGDTLIVLPAHGGQFYAGFDAKTDNPGRQGVQAKASICGLNSGNYRAELFWARAYQEAPEVKIYLSLSNQMDSRKYVFDDFDTPLNYVSGQWYQHVAPFQIDLNDQDHADNDWFSITGQQLGNSNPRHYVYIDDVRLFRPCDQILRCSKTHGQICPAIATQAPPADPIWVSNIANASDIHVKIYSNPSAPVYDQTFHNGNGLPDFRLSRFALPVAQGTYHYDIEVSNTCGAFRKTGNLPVLDTSSYNPSLIWVDTAANWTTTPIPCCLNSLVLQNMQIVGDVSYIVRDQITVQGGVSVAPGSNVIIQAGNVVELDSVEFDGTNSTVEILEVPCPNRMGGEAGCGSEGGAMVIDAGNIVQPVETPFPAIAQPPAKPTQEVTTKAESETRMWASPNPFLGQVQLGFRLDEDAVCSLRIMDVQMRKVRGIIEGQPLAKGTHVINAVLNTLPAGAYLAELQAGDKLLHVRLIKL